MKLILICLVIKTFAAVNAQLPIPGGSCENFCNQSISNFDVNSIAGIWYTYATTDYPWQIEQSCSFLNITPISSVSVNVNSTEHFCEEKRLSSYSIYYTTDGHFEKVLTPLEFSLKGKIVEVSNDFFVEVYCHECGLYNSEGSGVYATIYSRIPYPDCASYAINVANDVLKSCGITPEALRKVDQEECLLCTDC